MPNPILQYKVKAQIKKKKKKKKKHLSTETVKQWWKASIEMSRLMTKQTKWHARPAKAQMSLGIRPVWSESSLCTQWVAKDPSFLHADSEDSDQTGRMPRLIWVFAGRTTTLLVLSWGGLCILNQILNATINTFLNNSKPTKYRLIPFKPWLDKCVRHSIFVFERSAWFHARAMFFLSYGTPFEKKSQKRRQIKFPFKRKGLPSSSVQCMSRPEMCSRFPDPTKVFAPALNILLWIATKLFWIRGNFCENNNFCLKYFNKIKWKCRPTNGPTQFFFQSWNTSYNLLLSRKKGP